MLVGGGGSIPVPPAHKTGLRTQQLLSTPQAAAQGMNDLLSAASVKSLPLWTLFSLWNDSNFCVRRAQSAFRGRSASWASDLLRGYPLEGESRRDSPGQWPHLLRDRWRVPGMRWVGEGVGAGDRPCAQSSGVRAGKPSVTGMGVVGLVGGEEKRPPEQTALGARWVIAVAGDPSGIGV